MRKANRILFDRLELEWRCKLMRGANLIAQAMFEEEVVKNFEKEQEEHHKDLPHIEFTSKVEVDQFGNIRNITEEDNLKEQLKKLEQQGKVLLEQEQYEALAELKKVYEILLKRLRNL